MTWKIGINGAGGVKLSWVVYGAGEPGKPADWVEEERLMVLRARIDFFALVYTSRERMEMR